MADVNVSIEAQNCTDKKKYEDWEVKDAVMTLLRAEEIKQDKELMALVAPKLKKQVEAVSALKALYGAEEGEKNEG